MPVALAQAFPDRIPPGPHTQSSPGGEPTGFQK
ncbi:hypothetical protein E2I00_015856, partial [Balaenoptera physalus]